MAKNVGLPQGFVLDQGVDLPEGFVVDNGAALPDGFTLNQPTLMDRLKSSFELKKGMTNDQLSDTTQAGRFVHGVMDAGVGLSQLVPRGISAAASLGGNYPNVVSKAYDQSAAEMDKYAAERAQAYDEANILNETEFDGMRLMGNVASPVNTGIGKLAAAVPLAKTFFGKLAQNAAISAAASATAPVEDLQKSFEEQKAKQLSLGALFGAGLQAAGSGLARVIRPNTAPEVQQLLDAGVKLTPGQILGGKVKSIENAMTSVPIVGDSIKSAYRRGYDGFNTAVANKALAPIGKSVPENVATGYNTVSYVKDALSKSYDDILPKMQGNMFDQEMRDTLKNIYGEIDANLPPEQVNQMQKILSNVLDKKVAQDGTITGESAKEVMTALRQAAEKFKGSQDPNHQTMGELFSQTQEAFSKMLQKGSAPELAQALKNTDAGYANFIRLQKASGSLGAANAGGVFTPAQLSSAVRGADKSLRKSAFSQGEALMQDLSGAGVSVLPSNIPDSGTALRSIVGLGTLGAVGAGVPVAAPAVAPLAVGALSGAAAYSKPGVALMQMVLAQRPELATPVAQALRLGTSPTDIIRVLFAERGAALAK